MRRHLAFVAAALAAFLALEWTNQRLGRAIREIRLKGSTVLGGGTDSHIDDFGAGLSKNGAVLRAISVVCEQG